jgi:predicted permease
MDHLLLVTMHLDVGAFPPGGARALQETGIARVRELPGVRDVTGSNAVALETSWAETIRIDGIDSLPTHEAGGPYINRVEPNYFTTVDTRIVDGRGFEATDRAGAPLVAVVGEAMARLIWNGANPIGRCVHIGADTAPCTEVVGVAQDAPRSSLLRREVMQYYVPSGQHTPEEPHAALYVRTDGPADALREQVRATLQGLAPDLPWVRVQPMWEIAAPEIRTWRLGSLLFGVFGTLALAVAAVGLYSVVSFDVARRTREIGIRVALGAGPREISALVLRTGLIPVGVGLLLGLALAAVATRWLAPLLFQTDPRDPGIFLGVAVILGVSSILACLAPAWRAVRVSPLEALRTE